MLEEKGSVTVQELTGKFRASESTIRRDLNALHKKGALVKVFWRGSTGAEQVCHEGRKGGPSKRNRNRDQKICIARYAASLIEAGDFVYLDAGTTTGYMIPFIQERSVTFVTNAVSSCVEAF